MSGEKNKGAAAAGGPFAELLTAITLEAMFRGFGGGDLKARREMWNRLCRHTGAPEKQVN